MCQSRFLLQCWVPQLIRRKNQHSQARQVQGPATALVELGTGDARLTTSFGWKSMYEGVSLQQTRLAPSRIVFLYRECRSLDHLLRDPFGGDGPYASLARKRQHGPSIRHGCFATTQHTQKVRPLEVGAAERASRPASRVIKGMAMQMLGASEAFGTALMGAGE